jgi:hypothetical protein
MRPRDVIQFFNLAILKAVGEPAITEAMLLEAEGEYSRDRMKAIADEYSFTYPNLMTFVELLYGRKERFELSELEDLDLLERVETALSLCNGTYDRLRSIATEFKDDTRKLEAFRRDMFSIFYEVGIVGLQGDRGDVTSWTYESRRSLSRAEINDKTRAYIHPMLFRRLGTRTRDEPLINE